MFVQRQVRLGVVQVASVNIVADDLIDTLVHKLGTFCSTWIFLENLRIDQ